jgi:hypothetical protein
MLSHTGILGVVASLAMLATPAAARGPYAGGLDLAEACRWQYGNQFEAYNNSESAWDWKCKGNGGTGLSIDTNAYCARKYGRNAVSDPQGQGKYDWACYYPN